MLLCMMDRAHRFQIGLGVHLALTLTYGLVTLTQANNNESCGVEHDDGERRHVASGCQHPVYSSSLIQSTTKSRSRSASTSHMALVFNSAATGRMETALSQSRNNYKKTVSSMWDSDSSLVEVLACRTERPLQAYLDGIPFYTFIDSDTTKKQTLPGRCRQ